MLNNYFEKHNALKESFFWQTEIARCDVFRALAAPACFNTMVLKLQKAAYL